MLFVYETSACITQNPPITTPSHLLLPPPPPPNNEKIEPINIYAEDFNIN